MASIHGFIGAVSRVIRFQLQQPTPTEPLSVDDSPSTSPVEVATQSTTTENSFSLLFDGVPPKKSRTSSDPHDTADNEPLIVVIDDATQEDPDLPNAGETVEEIQQPASAKASSKTATTVETKSSSAEDEKTSTSVANTTTTTTPNSPATQSSGDDQPPSSLDSLAVCLGSASDTDRSVPPSPAPSQLSAASSSQSQSQSTTKSTKRKVGPSSVIEQL